MESRCAVMRKEGFEINAERLKVPTWAAVYVDLPTRVADPRSASSQTQNVAGAASEAAERIESFPWGTDDLADGDHVDVYEGELAGRVFKIEEATGADQKTARRVKVIEVPRPVEWG